MTAVSGSAKPACTASPSGAIDIAADRGGKYCGPGGDFAGRIASERCLRRNLYPLHQEGIGLDERPVADHHARGDEGVHPHRATLADSDAVEFEGAVLPGQHHGTFRGDNATFVTDTAAFEKYWVDGGVFEHSVVERGGRPGDGLARIAGLVEGTTCRGRGLLAGAAYERHLLVETSGARSKVLKAPPVLNISQEEIDEGLDILMEAARAVLAAPCPLGPRTDGGRETMPSTGRC